MPIWTLEAGRQDNIPLSAVPVGSVEFVQARMSALGLPFPAYETYPDELADYFGRKIWQSTYAEVVPGCFVKPASRLKAFTGHIKGEWPEGEAVPDGLEEMNVWASEPVTFASEVRIYIRNGVALGLGRYDPHDTVGLPDSTIMAAAIDTYRPDRVAYTLDFGLTSDGRTLLVEANDAWAIGYYPDGTMTEAAYIGMIEARWREIAGISVPMMPVR